MPRSCSLGWHATPYEALVMSSTNLGAWYLMIYESFNNAAISHLVMWMWFKGERHHNIGQRSA